jgi:quercetin dioxygenase-like cupin family protein
MEKRMRHRRRFIECVLPIGVLAIGLSATSAHGAPPAPSVETLIETERTILDQPIFYPSGTSKITAQIITLPSGASTSLHLHAVPMFAYILKGELVVDYGSSGERRYRKGDTLVEAIDWPHRGRNAGKGKVQILVVFSGAEGTPSSEILPD